MNHQKRTLISLILFLIAHIAFSAALMRNHFFPRAHFETLFCSCEFLYAALFPFFAREAIPYSARLPKLTYLLNFLCALFCAFSMVGNQTILLPLQTSAFPKENYLYFFAFALWAFPLIVFAEFLADRAAWKWQAKKKAPETPFLSFAIVFFVLIGFWAIWLAAYYPAIISNDTCDSWNQAVGILPFSNIHPVIYSLLMKAALSIYPNLLSLAIAQMLFGAIIFARIFADLRQKGVPLSHLAAATISLGLLPNVGLQIISLWKDIPFAISLTWLTFLLYKTLAEPHFSKSPIHLCELCISLTFVALFRHNGIFPFLASAIFLFFHFIFKNRKGLFCLGATALLIFFYRDGLMKLLHVEAETVLNVQLTSSMINDFIAVDKLGGTIPPQATEMITQALRPLDAIPFSYYRVDGVWRDAPPGKWRFLNEGNQLLPLYLEMIIKNPVQWVKAALLRLDLYWNIPENELNRANLINFTGNPDETYHHLNLIRRRGKLTSAMDAWLKISADSPAALFLWRIGFCNIICLIAAILFIKAKKIALTAIFLPYFATLPSFFPTTLPDYRFIFSFFLIGLLTVSLTPLCLSERCNVKNQ